MYNGLKPNRYIGLAGHSGPISSVAFSKDGKFLASGSHYKTIKVWNFKEKREEFTLTGHSGSVNSVTFSKDGKFLAGGSYDKTIKV